jgi:flagellar biosynthesis protein FliR
VVPLGGIGPERLPVQELAGLLTAGLHLAFRLSMPVLLIIMLENVVLGFITKTVPQLNIMSFGFPVRILLGLVVLIASMGFIGGVIRADVSDTIDRLHGWVDSLGEPLDEGRGA